MFGFEFETTKKFCSFFFWFMILFQEFARDYLPSWIIGDEDQELRQPFDFQNFALEFESRWAKQNKQNKTS